jgi:hypothetical protein
MSTLIDKYQCGPLIKFGKYNLQKKWLKLFKSRSGTNI